MAAKERLDKLLVERGISESRQKAQALIMTGGVLVNDTPVDKAGTRVLIDAEIRLKNAPMRYVSRGGLKLEAALEAFAPTLQDKVALDLGASTGGFTDCMLQHGCRKVFAVDVGYGQLHPKLRQDPRVVCMERTNARHLTLEMLDLAPGEEIDLITADLSFISLHLIFEAISRILPKGGEMLALVKPQFEAGREHVPKGGVIRDHDLRKKCADRVAEVGATFGIIEQARADCPVHGPKGNIEILMHLKREQVTPQTPESDTEQA